MEILPSSLTLSGVTLVGVGLLVIVGLVSLIRFWFGGPDPFVQNAAARVEAGQNPANLLTAGLQYRRARRLRGVIVVAFVFALLTIFVPDAAEAIVEGFARAVGFVFAKLMSLLQALLATIEATP
jgi:hypothetical protein